MFAFNKKNALIFPKESALMHVFTYIIIIIIIVIIIMSLSTLMQLRLGLVAPIGNVDCIDFHFPTTVELWTSRGSRQQKENLVLTMALSFLIQIVSLEKKSHALVQSSPPSPFFCS